MGGRGTVRACALGLAVALGTAACSDEPSGELPLPLAVSSAPAPATTSAAPTPSPTPTPTPTLRPFEDDPAAAAVYAFAAAAADAVNSGNLGAPSVRAVSTDSWAQVVVDLLREDLGTHYPGPQPLLVRGVVEVSPTSRSVQTCTLNDGWALDRPGGTPVEPVAIDPATFSVLLVDGAWRVDDGVGDPAVDCAGLTVEDLR